MSPGQASPGGLSTRLTRRVLGGMESVMKTSGEESTTLYVLVIVDPLARVLDKITELQGIFFPGALFSVLFLVGYSLVPITYPCTAPCGARSGTAATSDSM